MKTNGRRPLVAPLPAVFAAASASAQGTLQKKITYTIDVTSAVDIGEHRLPAGRYILYQIDTVDPIDDSDLSATTLLKGWVVPGVGGRGIVRVDAPKGSLMRPGE